MAKGYNQLARTELEDFLASLDLEHAPKIHVNGKEHPTAIVVVDFGAPLRSVRLTLEQNQELMARVRRYTKDVVNKDVHIRVASDNYNGLLYWSNIQINAQ